VRTNALRAVPVALAVGWLLWQANATREALAGQREALAALGLRPGQDPTSKALARYAALAPWLPRRGVAGYWCQATGAKGVLASDANDALGARWIDAQLALAPLRLVLSLEQRFVVADFQGETPRPPEGSGLVLRHELEPGLAVFEDPRRR
jgi:hypothetical protein